MLETIYQYTPDICHRDSYGRTPLHFAARIGNQTAIDFLLKVGQNQTDENGNVITPATEINVNAQTIGGETPLMRAAECGNLNICIALLKAGSDPFY